MWQWLLSRQGVAEGLKLDSVEQIADQSLGLHAARLSSPFTTAMARASADHIPAELFDAEQQSLVTTVRCMRKTLHTLPLPLASLAHSATVHFRERDALRFAFNARVDTSTLVAAAASIERTLGSEGALSHRDLEVRLCGNRFSKYAIRAALKVAWERGDLTYRNNSGGWNKERRTFDLTNSLYPDFEINMDRERATAGLVYHYFDRYGPASVRDVMWWSGLSRSAIVTGMNAAEEGWVSMDNPWSDNLVYMLPSRLKDFYDDKNNRQQLSLNFLAHEDVALKAYFETRKRYLGSLASRRIFNQIGEVLPAIMHGGQVAGKWGWDVRNKTILYDVFDEYKDQINITQLTSLHQRYTDILKRSTV